MELKASDLRVGNWVTHTNNPKQINVNNLLAIFNGSKLCKGIPLTPEILLKAGFEQFGMWFIKDYLYICIGGIIAIDEWKTPYKCPKYLHELQNLVKALTSTELKIEL